jgi:hypothetical protein
MKESLLSQGNASNLYTKGGAPRRLVGTNGRLERLIENTHASELRSKSLNSWYKLFNPVRNGEGVEGSTYGTRITANSGISALVGGAKDIREGDNTRADDTMVASNVDIHDAFTLHDTGFIFGDIHFSGTVFESAYAQNIMMFNKTWYLILVIHNDFDMNDLSSYKEKSW